MVQVHVERAIEAPVATVFGAVTDIERLPETNPDIVGVEFLSEQRSGVGTRFRETRLVSGREDVTELEVTEWADGEHARMVADSHGSVWDTVFRVRPTATGALLELTMDARAHKLLPRLLNPVFKGLFRRGLEKHLDAVQAWCEAQGGSGTRDHAPQS